MSGTALGSQGFVYYVPSNALATLPTVTENVMKGLSSKKFVKLVDKFTKSRNERHWTAVYTYLNDMMLANTVYVNSTRPSKNTTIILVFSLPDGTSVYTGTGNNFNNFTNGNLPMSLNQNYGLMQANLLKNTPSSLILAPTLDKSGLRPIYLTAINSSTGLCCIQMKG